MTNPFQTNAGIQSPEAALRVARFLWLAMLAGQLILGGFVLGLRVTQKAPPVPEMAGVFTGVAFVVTLVLIAVGLFVRGETYKRFWQGAAVTPQGYVQGNLLLLAMCEGATLLGAILMMLCGEWFPIALAPAISFAAFVVNFPNGRAMQNDDPFARPPTSP